MTTTTQPIVKQLVVRASQAHAFSVFTTGINRWWPREHHIGKSPLKEIVVEPRTGGRWYSICEDLSEINVGKVLAWEPPGRLLLAWQINGAWTYDPEFLTELEVTFVAGGASETHVRLEHRNLERFGPSEAQLRGMFDAPEGWTSTLADFARAAEG